MNGKSMILAALAVIAVTTDFRVEGLPRPQEDVENFKLVDGFAFDGSIARQIPLVPGMNRPRTTLPTTRPAVTVAPTTPMTGVAECMQKCRVTSEYNPVCGTDQTVYTNPGMLNCVRNCGQDVRHSHFGPCTSNIRG